ncbi:PAS domain-containing protein [Pedobacter africanus]|uniref:histidine kinase n=1 Tax=Pedobacter africanus TaxID=151894 RepID=A0A1W2A006_9SPHI|nr:PAS domain-containing protein [Pedobacter africanus]SMC54059.1 PAS domain S-box-containing protein [Pedobacter africanus]
MESTGFYNLFEKSPLPMWVFDIQTLLFLDVNIAAVENYGYSKSEFLTMSISDIRPADEIDAVKNIVEHNAKTGKFFKNIFRHVKKNGDLIFVEIESNLIEFKGRQARIVLAQDISEKLIAEQQLALSEQRFKALVQEGSELIAIVDIDLNYKYVSPTSRRILGIDPHIFIGQNALQYIHKDDVQTVVAEAGGLNLKPQVKFSPFRFRHGNGEWRWIETCATNLTEDLSVQGIVCNSSDITDRIESQKQIMENVERYNIVARATRDVIWDYDLRNQKITWNRGISGILKYKSIGHITDAHWWENNIHPEDRGQVVASINRHIMRGAKLWTEEYRFLCGDGEYRYMMDRGYVGFDQTGKPYRMIGAMQDITQNKMQMKAIEEQNKKLKEIAWLQSHAVRAPLTKIMSLAELLQYSCKDEETKVLLKYLSESSAELDEVIANISKNAG